MSIIDALSSSRLTVLLVAAVFAIGGLLAYVNLPKESQPQIEFAMLVVTTVYPGVSPDDVESILTQPIEREVATISGLDVLRSTSTEGVSTVIAEFLPSKDLAEASREVREAIDRARTDFPSDVEEPVVADIDFADIPVLTVNLLTSGSLTALRATAEDLQDALEAVPGVTGVDLLGGLEREVQVAASLAALQGAGLTINDIVQAVQTENTNIPGGQVDVGPESYLVRVNGEFERPEEIADLVVAAPGGVPVYVRDLAEVRFGYKERTSYARLNVLQRDGGGRMVPVEQPENRQVIRLNVRKATGENIIQVVDRAEAVIAGFPLPPDTEIVLTGDQSEDVATLVKDLENNIIAGVLFVVLVLLFFLGVRNATIVGVAIPLSMMLAFLVFQVMGQTLNFIILFSLIIALGMLVDNAIVIVENIYRFRTEGYGRWEASRLATREVAVPVATSTLTTIAAFAPMLFWPGIIGKFMGYMPLTLIVTLTCSLYVALFITPTITGFVMRVDGVDPPPQPMGRTGRRVVIGVVALVAAIVGLANWKTLVFGLVAVPLLWALYRFVLAPATERFQTRVVPRLTERYQTFLRWMLLRDYTVPRALLRNTAALGSFTLGFLLLAAGGALQTVAAPSGWLLIAPGGVLLVLGLVGILVHAAESIFLGGRASVRAGLWFGGLVGGLTVLLILSGRLQLGTEDGVQVLVGMFFLPALLVAVGALGVLRARRRAAAAGELESAPGGNGALVGRPAAAARAADRAPRVTHFGSPYLLLTDNRARLLTATLGLLVGVFALFAVAPTGVVFFPTTDPSYIQITAEAATGTTIERSDEIADDVYRRVMALVSGNEATRANTENVATSVGVGGDVMFGGGQASPERSQVVVNLADYHLRAESSTETLRRVRDELDDLPGVDLQVAQNQDGPPTGSAVNIEVSGRDFAEIQRLAEGIKGQLAEAREAGRVTGLVDLRDNLGGGRPEYQVRVDRVRAAAFGLSTQDVALGVRSNVNGVQASVWRDGRDEYDITVRLREVDRASVRQIESLTIAKDGRTIPLTAVAEIVPATGLGSVTRLDQQRVVTVLGEAAPGVNPNALLAEVQAELAETVAAAPAGYTIRYTGASEEQNESFSFLTTALLIGIALITLVLIGQFNSVRNPLIIMIAVGLSLIGVLLGLILTRTPFGLMTFIGIISLAGIVVNNAIVLVDYIEQLRGEGVEKQDAVVAGGATRLRPVLLTALTTVIGLIPLTFGINVDFVGLIVNLDPAISFGSTNTQFWGPMGTAIISGLTFATFLTLVIVPVMYSSFDSVAMRLAAARSRAARPAFDGDGTADVLPATPAVAQA